MGQAPSNPSVALGRIVGAHGLRGQIRVRAFGGDTDGLLRLQHLKVGEAELDASVQEFEVGGVKLGRAGEVRMALVGVERRETAEALRGKLVMTEIANLEALPDGEYYGYQLVGCRVFGDDGNEIGTVAEIWQTGAPDVLVVKGDDGRQILIPAAEQFLREVDIDGRRIVIAVIPGLLD